jgi:hypothetical protein
MAATTPAQAAATTATSAPLILPKMGVARVKSVMSGDTVILLGKAVSPSAPPPEVMFTLEGLSAPRYVHNCLREESDRTHLLLTS